MAIKQCVVCGRGFRACSTSNTCSPKCLKEKKRKHSREWARKERATNPERVRELRRKWTAINREKINEQCRKRRPAKIKQCVVCGGDFKSLGPKKTCSKGCSDEHGRRLCRKYAADNPEYTRKRYRKYREANLAACLDYERKKYAIMSEAFRMLKQPQPAKPRNRKRTADQRREYHRVYNTKLSESLRIIKQLQQGILP